MSPRLLSPANWLALAALGLYLGLAAQGFGPSLADDHGFRQTQTAISARYLDSLADLWNYETPVLGVPWQVPFEFPLMQALAKAVHAATGLDLVSAGRLVSMAFFLACLWPLWALARGLGVQEPGVAVAIVVLMPLHVFWSRAFMIETTALFFTLMTLWALWRGAQAPTPGNALAALGWGSLAALVKVTTLLPALGLATLCAWPLLRQRRWRPLALFIAVQAAILAVALAWVAHTDAVKRAHPLARQLTSEALAAWNYGSWQQRFDGAIWLRFVEHSARIFADFSPAQWERQALLAGAALLFFVLCLALAQPAARQRALLLLLPYLLGWAVFTNLHQVHSYYQMAGAVFLALALAVAFDSASAAAPRRQRVLLWLMLLALLLGMAQSAWGLMQRKSSHHAAHEGLVQAVRELSPAGSVILVDGLDWTSELAWRAERRALMLPNWAGEEAQARAITLTRAQAPVSLYLNCWHARRRQADRLQQLGLVSTPAAPTVAPAAEHGDCRLFPLPPTRSELP